MTEPRVTALLPVYRYHAPFLAAAAASMLAQTSSSWRLLVIYDGAVPGVRAALGDAAADERVRIVRNEGRKLSGALNTGMRQATTEFTGILLGDDLWEPHAVAVLESAIERFPDVDFFHSARRCVDGDGSSISGVRAARAGFTTDDFVAGSPVKHLLCWRRELGLAIGGLDESLECVGPDDYDFPWSMAEASARFMPIQECLYVYRDHRDSFRLTTHVPLSVHVREMRRIRRKHGVDEERIEAIVAAAQEGFLRQCLYRSRFDRWVKTAFRYDAHRGWREPYT
jgi:glycosyltransferase involved in cell wall biosynthesis